MDEQIEQDIKAAGADRAPRITPSDIEANIASEHYFTASDGVIGSATEPVNGMLKVRAHQPGPRCLELLTFCVLVLRNGFTVVGTSACASPENFNAEIGRKIARQKAVVQVGPLMGYELRSEITRRALEGNRPPPDDEKFPEDDFPF